ncbi:hypothetical protein FRB97_003134 [Tulasnella sp. 331]|nr:hypothetical protein FRB97_003134 [Tulasnella sp. 331]
MSDEEQSVSSSTYSSDGEEAEEELELDEYGEAEPEAEGEGEGEAEGDDADADAEADADPDAEPDNEGEVEGADGEGEGEESDEDDEDVDASTESSDEEEEEELDADDAEGDDDLEDDGGDLEAALENMEAMDDEQQDEEMARARLEVPAPAEKQATATQLRRKLFCTPQPYPRSYAIDPICALPHPVATSCLASSVCMTYLATGSEDGFVRCYDFFAGVNGKTFLTAPQRHHCGIGEGTMKAGVLKMWWENYAPNANTTAMSLVGTGVGLGGSVKNENGGEDKSLSPVHSMIMQGDALWSLSGTATGHVNLTTIRHEPGKTHHTFSAHNKGPVSCLALTPDEHGFFSAGWDGDTKACQIVRVFGASQQRDTSSQVVSLGLRPQVPISQANAHNEVPNADLFSIGFDDGNGGILPSNSLRDPNDDGDSHSSSSDNSLFGDDDDDDDSGDDGDNSPKQSKTARRKLTGRSDRPNGIPSAASGSGRSSVTQSPDLLMTAYIDGQVLLWDRRASPQSKPLRLEMGEKSPPWCVSYKSDKMTGDHCSAFPPSLYSTPPPTVASILTHAHQPIVERSALYYPISTVNRVTRTQLDMIRQPNPTNAAATASKMARPAEYGSALPQRPPLDGMRSYSQSTSGSSSPSLSDSDPRSGSPASSMSSMSSTSTINSDRADAFFRTVCGRELNTMNTAYVLPADDAEIKRLEQEHRLLKFVLNSNYVGNIGEVLASSKASDKRIIDCGTGSGLWCIEVAEEFPKAVVIGVDLAPIQPREVPPNCSFELFDLDGQQLPYPDCYFDVIHVRSVYTGIRNYPLFLRECARVLRKNGLIILAEADTTPLTDNKRVMSAESAPGWTALWNEYRRGLLLNGFDVTIPTRLRALLQEIPCFKDNIVAQEALVPIGFWPKEDYVIDRFPALLHPQNPPYIHDVVDQTLLTIGQLSWMNQDSLLPALIPHLVTVNGLSEAQAQKLVELAQKDLYFPQIRPFVCWHFAYSRKSQTVR